MASNPGRVPAGGREKIGVEVSTQNRGGNNLRRNFRVYTNDPSAPQVSLVVTGKVKSYIYLSSSYIRFMGKPGQDLRHTVTIKPMHGQTLKIQDVKAREGKHLAWDLKPKGDDAARYGYQLVVRNTMRQAGSYRDLITIKTDSPVRPTLRIPVSAHIRRAPGQPELVGQ